MISVIWQPLWFCDRCGKVVVIYLQLIIWRQENYSSVTCVPLHAKFNNPWTCSMCWCLVINEIGYIIYKYMQLSMTFDFIKFVWHFLCWISYAIVLLSDEGDIQSWLVFIDVLNTENKCWTLILKRISFGALILKRISFGALILKAS